jgi:GntR family transcriptional repressor for pyruvate dehydrogenase complex
MRQPDHDLRELRHYLQGNGFEAKDRLPPERELAATLGLTRNRLRTGLKKLAAEGLIWRHVGKGTFFGPRLHTAGIADPVAASQDLTSPREVMAARLGIEPALARLAALHATGRDLQEVGAALDRMTAVRDWDTWEHLDGRFHRDIAQAARNALMLVLFDTVQAHRNVDIFGHLREGIEPEAAMRRASREHAAILRALRNRDADAAEAAMRTHLREVERRTFGERG